MNPKTCVDPSGQFIHGIHKPGFQVRNLRKTDPVGELGHDENQNPVDNRANFPTSTVKVPQADWVFEIPNAFPFRGATYIAKTWADEKADHPELIHLPDPPEMSLTAVIKKWLSTTNDADKDVDNMFESMPEALQLATAVNSTDADDLVRLAILCCRFIFNPENDAPTGLAFKTQPDGHKKPDIHNHALFKAVANNPYLPDVYKEVMVLRPGTQGKSEIVGEWYGKNSGSHVFEYLRKNSYIPWGHFAANMADNAVRYRIKDLTMDDITGMRHLYYQRIYIQMADQLGLPVESTGSCLTIDQLEHLRQEIQLAILSGKDQRAPSFNRTLWGWNFGSDYAPSKYRLHASHQQTHQQYALLPDKFATADMTESSGSPLSCYGFGDLMEDFIRSYRRRTGKSFFSCYIHAIRNNRRMDENHQRPSHLIVYEDDQVILFVPKAQTSQWELQLMTLAPIGNILETDRATRQAIDHAIYHAINILGAMGARMITTIESSKRFDAPDLDQRLLYSFLPRLPQSPGAFSEAQQRWINGHYPEDFAAVCRNHATPITT